MRMRILFGLVSIALAVGCQKRTLDDGPAEKKSASANQSTAKNAQRPKPSKRTGIEGNWVLDIADPKTNTFTALAIVNVSKDDTGKFVMRLVDAGKRHSGLQLLSSTIDAKSFSALFFKPPANRRPVGANVGVSIEFINGKWIGVAQEQTMHHPARLVATDDGSIDKFLAPVPFENLKEFAGPLREFGKSNKKDGLRAIVRKRPGHPMSFIAAMTGLNPFNPLRIRQPGEVAAAELPTREDLEDHLETIDIVAAARGKRAAVIMRYIFAVQAQVFRVAPKMVQSIAHGFDNTEKYGRIGGMQQLIDVLKITSDFEVDLKNALQSKNRSEVRSAVQKLIARGQGPWRYQPMRLYTIAEGARRSDMPETALLYFGQLLVLPGLTGALEDDIKYRRLKPANVQKKFDSLWQEAGRDEQAKSAFLKRVYDESIFAFLKYFPPNAIEKPTSPVLIELFTGSEAPRCAAIDVGVNGIQKTFPASHVFVLRYHFPVPSHTPLGTSIAAQVARRLGTAQPPDILFNGMPWETMINNRRVKMRADSTFATFSQNYWSQSLLQSEYSNPLPILYLNMRRWVSTLIRQPESGYKLAVTADKTGDVVEIEAKVERPENASEDLHVRFVLAEDHFDYKGANGVRRHSMVVRGMPGGVNGVKVEPKSGVAKTTVDSKALRVELQDYHAGLKKDGKKKVDERFLKFRNLHLVAIVFDEKTNRVFDVASVMVLGQATKLLDRHVFGPVEASRPLDQAKFRAPPPPLPITPEKGKKK